MTLSKLAKLANVSVSVVSKAFSGRDDVSESMREHVFAVAKEHGCFHQFYHVPYDRPVVAVIIPEIISNYYIQYHEELKKALDSCGYTMLISISNFDAQMEEELINYYTVHSKVDALITFGCRSSVPKSCNTAFVSFSTDTSNSFGAHINRDIETGLYEALEYLRELGHERIAFIGEPFTSYQLQMVQNATNELGFDNDERLFICSRRRFEAAGKDGVDSLLRAFGKNGMPTAILGAYGYITQGILSALFENGLRVPEDISVISMDSNPFPINESLDVAHIPSMISEICREATDIIGKRIRTDKPNEPHTLILPTKFHRGGTVSCARDI